MEIPKVGIMFDLIPPLFKGTRALPRIKIRSEGAILKPIAALNK